MVLAEISEEAWSNLSYVVGICVEVKVVVLRHCQNQWSNMYRSRYVE